MTDLLETGPSPTDPTAVETTAAADPSLFTVRLTNFTGPFDLLLALISQRRLDVTEVALHTVTDDMPYLVDSVTAEVVRQASDRILDATQAVNVLATVGVAHRVTGPLNAALQLWTLTYRNSWGMLYHNDNMLVLHQMVLGAGPTADALSVDALVRRRGLAPAVFERRYGAVPVMLNAVTSAVYFVSGVAKVRSSTGFGWASGDVLRGQIAIDGLGKDLFGSTRPAAGTALYHRERLFTLMAAVSLAVELGAPLSLLDRRLGLAFSAAAWGMHIGIREIMGISFPYNTSGVSYLGHLPAGPQLRR